MVGLAKTGSGKTMAYAIPLVQALMAAPQPLFGVVITPTRELTLQVKEHIQALGSHVGTRVMALLGGTDLKRERAQLRSERPHVVVCSPGRLLDHVRNTQGFTLQGVRFLVFDEADRILGVDLEEHMGAILRGLPTQRRTMLFSATLNSSTKKLELASLDNAIKVKVNETVQLPDSLKQYMFANAHADKKLSVLVWFLIKIGADKDMSKSAIIFCQTRNTLLTVHVALKHLNFKSVPIFGALAQNKREGALRKFKKQERNILVATDLASRGLDIPHVEWVVNYDFPSNTKEYIHRVGRTARAGRDGSSLSILSSREECQQHTALEARLGLRMEVYPVEAAEVDLYEASVRVAERNAAKEVEEMEEVQKQEEQSKRKRLREKSGDRTTWKKNKK